MGTSEIFSEAQIGEPAGSQAVSRGYSVTWERVGYGIYGLALAVSISLWFLAVRAPLWLDENGSFWQIAHGFWKIPSRQGGLSFPAYSYILWFFTKILGTSETALRVPSIFAMLGAVYLLYRAARELFDRDVASIVAAVFCVHPVVIFAAIDVRPYAFAALAIDAALFALVRLRQHNSNWLLAVFGISAAFVVYFHFLFAVILPVLAICFVLSKVGDSKTLARQFAIAFAAFALAVLPVIPGLLYMFRTRGTHVFEGPPQLMDLGWTLAPSWQVFILGGAAFLAAATRKLDLQNRPESWRVSLCVLLGLVPILVLYGVSAETSIHLFVARHRLVAIPGIALCWGFLVSRIDSRAIRALFCVAVVAASAYQYLSSPFSNRHGYTWKYALEFAEKNASNDNAPVLICSDFPEADYQTMPVGHAKESDLFAPLSYYKLSVPVVPLPRALNDEAVRVASDFLRDAAPRRQRFLALGFEPSYPTLQWLADQAAGSYDVRPLGQSDGIAVLEFVPHPK